MTAVLFLGLILLPLLVSLLGHRESTAATEKREMAPQPPWKLALDSFGQFSNLFEKYYGDSFGLRENLIRWNNRLRIGLFGESPVRGVKLGKSGWLFYSDEWELEDYEDVTYFRQDELEKIRDTLEQRRKWLARRGIKFFIVVAPNKSTIYSEYLPQSIHKIGKQSRLDQLEAYLSNYPKIELIDLRKPLFSAKPEKRLYDRTDTHWNDFGAFVGYRAIVERIKKELPNVGRLSADQFSVTEASERGGDLAKMLSLDDLIREERIRFRPKFSPRAVEGRRDYADPASEPGREMVVKETGDPSLPKLVMFRDSFTWRLIPYLSESFQSSVFIWTHAFVPEIIEREKPDVVILECVERYLGALEIDNPPEVH